MATHPTDSALNDYVDGVLPERERSTIDVHLHDCAQCQTVLEDLREIRRLTASLGPVDPPPRVWTRVEQELRASGPPLEAAGDGASSGTERSARGTSSATIARFRQRAPGRGFGLPSSSWLLGGAVLAAAALVMAVFVGLRFGRSEQPDSASTSSLSGTVPSAQSIEAELQQAEEHYQKAIAGLEQIASANSGVFDAATAATLQKNLAVVDQAINESRTALRAQPNSEPAQASLLDSFKAKLALLQETVSLINEMRKGDDAAAARIVSGLKRGT